MKNRGILCGVILLLSAGLLLCFAPNLLTAVFLVGMCVVLAFGYYVGLLRLVKLCRGFRSARREINRARDVETTAPWRVLRQMDSLFGDTALDEAFERYKYTVASEEESKGTLIRPIEDQINEGLVENTIWHLVVSQIPSILPGLGILGTFIGLLIGINGIGFSSITVALNSIETVLQGIRIAFYTSISGVVLSILFNLMYNSFWREIRHEMEAFFQDFHRYIIPDTDEQMRRRELKMQEDIATCCLLLTEYLQQRNDSIPGNHK